MTIITIAIAIILSRKGKWRRYTLAEAGAVLKPEVEDIFKVGWVFLSLKMYHTINGNSNKSKNKYLG